jgi:hypothetical protein
MTAWLVTLPAAALIGALFYECGGPLTFAISILESAELAHRGERRVSGTTACARVQGAS